jgi:tetratricopeptide (TPR) repeat protein
MENLAPEPSPLPESPRCPFCGSVHTLFKAKAAQYECLDCEERFPPPQAAGNRQIDLTQKTTDPKKIFFSYGHDKNQELVDHFKTDLEKRGHSVWIDYKEIGTWEDWRGRITQGIGDSQLAIAFMSQYATRDPGVCRNEVALALDKFHTVYPVLMEPLERVSPPVTISHIQWQDLSNWQDIRDGKVPGQDWNRWYEARLIEIIDLVESTAGHFAGEIDVLDRILQPVSFTSEIVRHVPGFTGRQWVFDAYQDWLEHRPSSRLFWVQAGPGVGKTALAAVLANNHPSAIVSAWFCRSDSIERRDTRRAIMTIALQLAVRWPDYRTRLLQAVGVSSTAPESAQLQAREALNKLNSADLFHRLIKQPMVGLIWWGNKLVILIDALDEATDAEGGNPLTDLLVTDLANLPEWISFVVTSRPDPAVVNRLAGFQPFALDAEDPRNWEDLSMYLQRAIAQHPELHKLPSEQQEAIQQALLTQSEGMMLYVRLALDAYDAGDLDAKGLLNTPRGLGGMYTIQFRQRFATPSMAAYDDQVKPLLRALLAARGPLPESLARKILNDDLESWQRRKDKVASYLVRNEEGLLLFHKTLAEWLQSAGAGDFRVDPSATRRDLAQILWEDFQEHENSPMELQWREPVGRWLPEDLDILYPDPSEWATQANALARFLQEKLARYREAEPLYRQALEIRQKVLGPEHPSTAISLNTLALLLQDQGKFDEAEPLYRQALAIYQKVLGPEHPDTVESRNNLEHNNSRKR